MIAFGLFNGLAILAFGGALIILVMVFALKDSVYLIYVGLFIILGSLILKINGDQQEREQREDTLAEVSGLNVTGVGGNEADISCIYLPTGDGITITLKVINLSDGERIVTFQSNEPAELNKGNVKRYFPDLDCIAKG